MLPGGDAGSLYGLKAVSTSIPYNVPVDGGLDRFAWLFIVPGGAIYEIGPVDPRFVKKFGSGAV